MYKSIVLLLFWVLFTFGFGQSAVAADTHSSINVQPGICLPFPTQWGPCIATLDVGWCPMGGTVNPQRWECRFKISGVEGPNPTSCSIHALVQMFDANPLPVGGGNLGDAKQLLVNYNDNYKGNLLDDPHSMTSALGGISYDLKNGEWVDLILLSTVDNPLTVTGSSMQITFISTTPDCVNGRVPISVNYLAEQPPPFGYTFNVFQNEAFSPLGNLTSQWYFPAEGTLPSSRLGQVDTAVNVFNPSTSKIVTVHMVAYDQTGKLVTWTGLNGGVKSNLSDLQLNPLESLSSTLSNVLGGAITNGSFRVYVSTTNGPVMVTVFKRDGLGMTAPLAVPTIYSVQ